jgi:photosystem II stability/assembly factor-like uncharacterized protein
MRYILLLFLTAKAARSPQIQNSHSTESFRGISAVSRQVAWASGTHGTYLRTTNGGRTWTPAQVPDATQLDFRAVVAFSADEAFLMSAGSGDQSRIYHTIDAGAHWQLQFKNTNPKGFFDSMVFWDRTHGMVLGDPVPDDHGKLKFELLETEDGENWRALSPNNLPEAMEGEGAFAASNTCIAILSQDSVVPRWGPLDTWPKIGPAAPRQAGGESRPLSAAALDPNIWFATGGKAARVFHSADRGQTWQVFNTPIAHGPDSAGIFSITFRDAQHGVIAGGDYKHPKDDGPNLASTDDGGSTWKLSEVKPQPYFSAVSFDAKLAVDLFIVAQDYVLEMRPSEKPRHFRNKPTAVFNAISPTAGGGAFLVGAKGAIAVIP